MNDMTDANALAPAAPSSSCKPLVLVPACNRMLGEHPFYIAGKKYLDAVRLAGATPLIVPSADAEEIEVLLDLADGVLLTGSPSNVHPSHFGEEVHNPALPLDPVRDSWTLPLIRRALARGIPLFGICRGTQETNVALGGSLYQAVQEVDGHDDHRAPEGQPAAVQYGPAHPVEVVPGGVLEQLVGAGSFQVNSVHGQAVKQLAPGLRVEARAPMAWSRPSRSPMPRASACACSGTRNGWRPTTRNRWPCSRPSVRPADATNLPRPRRSDGRRTAERGWLPRPMAGTDRGPRGPAPDPRRQSVRHVSEAGASWPAKNISISSSWRTGSTNITSPRSNAWCPT
jgi:putative glutamine amidotransferase